MSFILEDCKGHVHMITTTGSGKRSEGFYAVEPPIPHGTGRCLLLGIPLSLQEIVQPTVTLDDERTLYIFGSAWSESALNGVLLLGDSNTGGKVLATLLSWYERNKVSKLKGPVSLSIGPRAIDAYVVGLRLDAADPAFNKQNFSIILLISNT